MRRRTEPVPAPPIPVIIAIAAGLAWGSGLRPCAGMLALAAVVYFVGGLALALALTLSVPMNESLATVSVPAGAASAIGTI